MRGESDRSRHCNCPIHLFNSESNILLVSAGQHSGLKTLKTFLKCRNFIESQCCLLNLYQCRQTKREMKQYIVNKYNDIQ